MTYSVSEAFDILKQENMTKSVQVLRRWLRTGELKGKCTSRKEGWRITETDLQTFIDTRKGNIKITKEALDDAYDKGYKQGHIDTVRRLIARGFGESVTIHKSALRYYVERDISSKERQREILSWIFGKRASINIRVLDNYVYLYDTGELVTFDDEDHIAGIIADMARKKVIAGEARKTEWIG